MNLWHALYWREPLWLVLSLLPLLVYALLWLKQQRVWISLVDPELMPWVQVASTDKYQRLSKWLMFGAWLLFCVALAGPRTAAWVPPELQGDDTEIIAVIDYSASMRVKDGQPNRISSAQTLLQAWIADLPERSALGLIAYAGQSHRLLIPTGDIELLQHFIAQLPALTLPLAGNNLADALNDASEQFSDKASSRHLIILTDGDIGEQALQQAREVIATSLADKAIQLHWIGLGTDEAGSVPQINGEPLIIDGHHVVSRRDTRSLQTLAEASSAAYYLFEPQSELAIQDIIALPEQRLPKQENHKILWNEYFAIPLIFAIALLLLSLQLSSGKSKFWRHLLLGLSALWFGGCELASTSAYQQQLYSLLSQEEFISARQLAAQHNGYTARFAEGIACYRLADYHCAADAFARAAWNAANPDDQGRAVFNLANTHFKLGDYEQAAVLFRDAGLLGVDVEKVSLNKAYADSLAASMRQYRKDIAETQRRAELRAAAGQIPDGFEDRLADGIELAKQQNTHHVLRHLSQKQYQALIVRGIQHAGNSGADTPTYKGQAWIKSAQNSSADNTAALFNRLMPMEAGLATPPNEPLLMQGQRAW